MGIDSISSSQPFAVDGVGEVAGPVPDLAVAIPDAAPPIADAFVAGPAVLVAEPPPAPAAPVAEDVPTMKVGADGTLTLPTSVTTLDGTGQTIDQNVKQNVVQTIDLEGSNNKIDLSGDPKPVPGAQANIILGGSHNSGEVDVQGTIVVKAGDHNDWTVNKADVTLDEKAPPKNVIFEGSMDDWSMTMDGNANKTFTNKETGTSCFVPLGVQTGFVESTKPLEAILTSNPAAPQTKVLEASGFKLPTGEVKAFIDWQRVQYNPLGSGTIGDAWKSVGNNPYLNPQAIQNAKDMIAREKARNDVRVKAGQPSEVADWLKPGATNPKPKPVAAPYTGRAVFGGTVTVGPAPIIGPAKAPTPVATLAAKPTASERAADQVIAQEYPGLGQHTKEALRKLLLSLMRHTGRHGATDLKHMAHSKQATALITAGTS